MKGVDSQFMKLTQLIEQAALYDGQAVAVAAAEDEDVIEAVIKASKYHIATFQLYGNETVISSLLKSAIQDDSHLMENISIIHCSSTEQSAERAVQAVSEGKAQILMKGMLPTAKMLKAVLHKEYGLRTSGVLSHIAAFELPTRDKLLYVTDAAMNIAPDLVQKQKIIENAVGIASAVSSQTPKVAVLAAVETVNPAMQATLDAAALTQMNKRGQIKGCVVDGPLAFDNAISKESAAQKGIYSDVAGQADILLVPAIEVGNALYKSFMYFSEAKVGAVIAGAKAPIVLTSRSDSAESKLYSLALAVCSAKKG